LTILSHYFRKSIILANSDEKVRKIHTDDQKKQFFQKMKPIAHMNSEKKREQYRQKKQPRRG